MLPHLTKGTFSELVLWRAHPQASRSRLALHGDGLGGGTGAAGAGLHEAKLREKLHETDCAHRLADCEHNEAKTRFSHGW